MHRPGKVVVAALLAMLMSGGTVNGQTEIPPAVAKALDRAGVPHSAVGILVHDLTRDKQLIDVAGDTSFNPASVMKLITTFAALEILGPAFTWKTEVWTDGALVDGRLEGNLYFRGYGDPKLTLERFWLVLRELRDRGLRDIAGSVYLDRSAFAIGTHDPAEFDGEAIRPYNVGPDALLLNYKTFRLRFVPDEEANMVRILTEPDLAGVSIINNLALAPGRCNVWPKTPTYYENTLAFTGVFPKGCGEKHRYYSLLEPDEYFSAVFRELWGQLGGTVAGSIEQSALPENALLFTTHYSPSLAEVVREINKFSNNVMARHLFLTLGHEHDYPLTTNKARTSLNAWLENRQFDFTGLDIDNGSGLSRSSRITPRQLGEVLEQAWRSPLMPEFVSSLPLFAVDGTLMKKHDESPVAGHAHIKTGYLADVRAIAGYVVDLRGRTLAVVFFINHGRARYAANAQVVLLEWIRAEATAD